MNKEQLAEPLTGNHVVKNTWKKVHKRLVFGRRINVLSDHLANFLSERKSLKGLDVGCGSGELASLIQMKRANVEFEGVEVIVRPEEAPINIRQFDGTTLPFADHSFDFVMIVDVCHHTTEPEQLLKECARVARKFILIKDVWCKTKWERDVLSFMDWVGNRAHDVPLPYNFFSPLQWRDLFERMEVRVMNSVRKLNLYPQPFSLIFDGELHFIEKLEL